MKSFIKHFFMKVYWLSLILALSSQSFLLIWMAMEMNLLMFVSISNKMSFNLSNSLMKYFIMQSMSSSLFLFTSLFSLYENTPLVFSTMILLAFWLKMGLFPFHQWYFQMSENLEWKMWFLLNSFNKIIPIWMMSFKYISYSNYFSLILLNSTFMIIEIWNQTSLRWMINSSSLNHISWLLASFNSLSTYWLFYFSMYSTMLLFLVFFLSKENENSISNFITEKINNNSIMLILIMMNFMGLPPFLGFLPKYLVIMSNTSFCMMMTLITINMIIIYMYLLYCVNTLKSKMFSKIINPSQGFNQKSLILTIFLSPLIIFM